MSIPATFEVSQATNLMPTAETFNFVQLRSRKKAVAIARQDLRSCPTRPNLMQGDRGAAHLRVSALVSTCRRVPVHFALCPMSVPSFHVKKNLSCHGVGIPLDLWL